MIHTTNSTAAATSPLSEAEWETLLGHIGYGNADGPLWFLGMEEALWGDRDTNLRDRLAHFTHPIGTLTELNALWHPDKVAPTPTWRLMAKIARLLLERASDWDDKQKAIAYARAKLGTAGGDTLLLELFPLPSPGIADWPYPDRFPDGREAYLAKVLPERVGLIRGMAERHRPLFVFCYGKKFWPYHREIFPMPDYRVVRWGGEKATVEVGVGHFGRTTIILTPFFSPYLFPMRVVAGLPGVLGMQNPTVRRATSEQNGC